MESIKAMFYKKPIFKATEKVVMKKRTVLVEINFIISIVSGLQEEKKIKWKKKKKMIRPNWTINKNLQHAGAQTRTHTHTAQCGRFQIAAAGDINFVVLRIWKVSAVFLCWHQEPIW